MTFLPNLKFPYATFIIFSSRLSNYILHELIDSTEGDFGDFDTILGND